MTDKKTTQGVIEGTLAYAKIAQADKKYKSEDLEYSIVVVIDEDTAETWDEEFAKQPAKRIKSVDFEDKYKCDNPFPDDKYVYIVTLKRAATKDGVAFNADFRPKVFLDTEDGERLDITESRLVANGSIGKVSYRIQSNDYGNFAYLQNVLIQEADFIEYESTSQPAGAEFGGEKTVKKEAARKEATEARKSKNQHLDPVDVDTGEDEVEKKTPTKPSKPTKDTTKKTKSADPDSPF